MHRVFIAEKICKEAIDYLKQSGIEVKFGTSVEEEAVVNELSDCDAVVVRTLIINDRIIRANPQLKLISKHGVGCDSIDVESAKKNNVLVKFTPGANSNAVAEHTIALMLNLSKSLIKCVNEYSSGNHMVKNEVVISELYGKSIGLIGFGNIAKLVAQKAYYGFNMKVTAYDPFAKEKMEFVTMYDNIDELLAVSDFVSLHIPLTDDNRFMVDGHFISKMKKGAYLINTARGELINTNDLVAGLKEKKIAGAGVDVTLPEPLPSNNELFKMDNVIVTPHCAASTEEAMRRMGMQCAKNIVEFFNGDITTNVFKV